MRRGIMTSVLAGAGLLMVAAARLGPPGICNTIETGTRASAVDKAWEGVAKRHLVKDLGGALDQFGDSTIARMEILRRASFTDGARGSEVAGALAVRALEKQAGEDKAAAAAALFDAGYAIHLFKTLGSDDLAAWGVKDGIAGYALVSRAITAGGDAGMHVGAAYMTLPAMQPRDETRVARARELFRAHAEAAVKGCTPGSAEEKNLMFVLQFEEMKIEAIRAKLARQ